MTARRTRALPTSKVSSSCFSPSPFVVDELRHVRDQDRKDQKGPDYAGLGIAGNIGQTHAVAEIQDDEDRQSDPHQVSRSSEYADPSEEDHGDDIELETERHV